MSQGQQPTRTGDVYPRSAADPEKLRRERDKVLEQGHQGQHDGALHVNQTDVSPGKRMVTATAAGQVLAQFTVPVPDNKVGESTDEVTFGEAIQAAAHTAAGDKPVGLADAAALQAAEMRATGRSGNIPGGVAATAQKAAQANMAGQQEGVTKLKDVVAGAAAGMPADKVVTRDDADQVAAAAKRNASTGGGGGEGVVDAVVAAADMNQGRM